MADNNQPKEINFSIDPNKTPIYQADGYLIGSNDQTVTFNFTQSMPGNNQQNIIARVALTPKEAKDFLDKLNDHIQKFEV
jgi:hypothetical protein